MSAAFVDRFRQAGPYINAHRGRTFVVLFGGEAVADPGFFNLVHDLALLHSLGVGLVLVHGARPQIEARLRQAGADPHYVGGLPVTDAQTLEHVKQTVGDARIRIEALLSMGLANSPMQGARIRVLSGNFVLARPLGVREGVDYCFTGEVRRIDVRAIRSSLDNGAVVLLSPLGYSPTGEVFSLRAAEIAVAAATAIGADKLLLLGEEPGLMDAEGRLIRELGLDEAAQLATGHGRPACLESALRACRGGVRRAHLLDRRRDGALLLELFTRDGVGTMINADLYEGLRSATIDDVGGILELIRPLEEDGTLVRRSRELLETEIERFTVLERDGTIIGCAALYPFADERLGELACLAVYPDYRGDGRAGALFERIEQRARQQGLQKLFVLTTRAAHWFREHGFEPAEIADLPVQRQAMYNLQRRSKVFVKAL